MKWMDSIVIGEKLCPFAPPVKSKLRIKVSNAKSYDEILRDVENEAHVLMGTKSVTSGGSSSLIGKKDHTESSTVPIATPETTLIVLDETTCPSLTDFRELVRLSWRVQEEVINKHSYASLLQQVLFHPLATHDTYGKSNHVDDDAADYTIRSPFPTIHLLREIDVMKAVTSGYKDLEGLPSRNKAKMRMDGVSLCRRRLEDCKDV
eukprot:CAMPEP_0178929740 /NCGR_PEP_ID=MMETSP0786-20121207/20801_1 /TAXON_ID=186022 /ORGANISM="Thalassionema frauenfeldii, Strain CCMP 1798" /LENGTH=205 /DNA_ID=CAMNT_0020606097 /DNA_START=209 /DNA_END=826 /DNA_ORIENTATION=+